MAKILMGTDDNVAGKIKSIYIGVKGVAKKVRRAYIGVDGVAKLCFAPGAVLIFESNSAGTSTISLSPGTYEITIIGAGGACGYCSRYVSGGSSGIGTTQYYGSQGGVGATLQVILKIMQTTEITMVIGAMGTTAGGGSSGLPYTGTNGGLSKITGIANTTLQANGGTGGKITGIPATVSGTTPTGTPGTMGTTSVSGDMQIVINNTTTITSALNSGRRANANWPENTLLGAGGGRTGYAPGNGYIRVVNL